MPVRLIAVSAGTYYHIESLEGDRYAGFFDRVLAPEQISAELVPSDCLFVPCRTPPQRMIAQKRGVATHLEAGGTVIAMGESRSDLWAPAIEFHERPTDWWWWLTEGADLGNRITAPAHPLLRTIGKNDITWHLHGHFNVPAGAEVLAEDREGRAIAYVDEVSTPGRLVVTSLDPVYHHGSHFMPATTRFLDKFLPNLKAWING